MNIRDPFDILLKLFNFRLKSINLLLDYNYLKKMNKKLPSLRIKEDEFNSFKFYILKNLSLNGDFIIRNPDIFGFENGLYSYIRYKKSFCWKRFNFLGHYSGDIYKYILEYANACEKVFKIKHLEELNVNKVEFYKILYLNGQNKNIIKTYTKKDSINFLLYYNDLDYRDYSKFKLQNVISKKGFYDLSRKKNFFNTTLGFYKAFLIIFNKNIKGIISNEKVNEILKKLKKFENLYSSKFKSNPYSWPWIFGEYVIKWMRDLYESRKPLENIP
ncbi:MAG: hypothetical protein ACTSVV_15635 [Promethearchaeota archaeon]